MDTPNINDIRTKTPEELAAIQRKAALTLSAHFLGMIFVKAAIPRLAGVLVRGLAHHVAK